MQLFLLCPFSTQFLHLAGLRGCFGISPLSGQVLRLCPCFWQIVQNLDLLLKPSYSAFSLLVVGRPISFHLAGGNNPTIGITDSCIDLLLPLTATSSVFIPCISRHNMLYRNSLDPNKIQNLQRAPHTSGSYPWCYNHQRTSYVCQPSTHDSKAAPCGQTARTRSQTLLPPSTWNAPHSYSIWPNQTALTLHRCISWRHAF